ncbi:Uncharacterised protein [Vibrio cholerae]|nr:Uncharacterised protein [Vibrio cholerae]
MPLALSSRSLLCPCSCSKYGSTHHGNRLSGYHHHAVGCC